MEEGVPLVRTLIGETLFFYQGTSFTRDSKRYVKEGSENGHLSPKGPCWGILDMRGAVHLYPGL
jgi:hypothetical protein